MPSDHKFRLLFFHCVINTCITCCHIQVRITADVAWPANPPVLCVSRWAYSGWNHCWYSMWYTLPPAAASRWESPLMLRDQPIRLSFVYPGEHIQVEITADTPCGIHCHLLPHPGENHRWCCVTSRSACPLCIQVSIFRLKSLLILHVVYTATCCCIQVRITVDVVWGADPPVPRVSRWAYSGENHCWYSVVSTAPLLHYPGENIQEKTTVDVAWPAEVSTFRWKSRLILSAISTCPLLAISRWEHSGGNHRWCHAWWTVPPAATVSRWDCSGASGCNHCWWLVISSSIWRCIQVRMSSQGLLISCSPPVNRFRPDSSCKQNKHDGTFPELGSWEKEHTNCNYKVTQAKGGRATFQP